MSGPSVNVMGRPWGERRGVEGCEQQLGAAADVGFGEAVEEAALG